jgi:hypothetical protein
MGITIRAPIRGPPNRAYAMRPDAVRPDALRPDALRPDALRPSRACYLHQCKLRFATYIGVNRPAPTRQNPQSAVAAKLKLKT